MNKELKIALYALFALFLLAVGSVVIREGSIYLARLGGFIMHLFA